MTEKTLDPDKARPILMEILASTFADMAFIDVEPSRPGAAQAGAPAAGKEGFVPPIRAAIDVLRPISCRLEIECPVELKQRIDETLFQGESVGGEQEDSLLEILNVAAGVFLTAYFGTGADIKLELPQYLYFSDGSEGEILAEARGDAEGLALRAVLRSIRYRY